MTATLCDTQRAPSPDESDEGFIDPISEVELALAPGPRVAPWEEPEPDQARTLARLVPPGEHWRLFADLRDRVRFLDIETLGLALEDPITVVGISDGQACSTLVRGRDLTRERLARALHGAGLLVTFNGTGFDVPRLRRAFPGLAWDLPHFDLAVEGRRLGLHGGLKRVERRLGYTRPRDLRGADGPEAVRLWRAHGAGDPRALRRLVRYCQADVQALVHLAERIHARLLRQFPPQGGGWLPRGRR